MINHNRKKKEVAQFLEDLQKFQSSVDRMIQGDKSYQLLGYINKNPLTKLYGVLEEMEYEVSHTLETDYGVSDWEHEASKIKMTLYIPSEFHRTAYYKMKLRTEVDKFAKQYNTGHIEIKIDEKNYPYVEGPDVKIQRYLLKLIVEPLAYKWGIG